MSTSVESSLNTHSSLGSAVSACLHLVGAISSVLCSVLDITSKTIGDFGITTASWFESKSILTDYVVRHLKIMRHHVEELTRNASCYLDDSLKAQLVLCDDRLEKAKNSSPRLFTNFGRVIGGIHDQLQALYSQSHK